jgi:hypothetical protein
VWKKTPMPKWFAQAAVLFILGGLYWQFVCQITNVQEPWDAPAYWSVAYPISLVLSATTGWFLKNRGWTAGAVLTLAQFPVIWLNNGTGSPFWVVGLLILFVLAIPAATISAVAGWFACRARNA